MKLSLFPISKEETNIIVIILFIAIYLSFYFFVYKFITISFELNIYDIYIVL